jgi:regulator of protease activity HflC (stomatin/prohibitin superfamily)
MELEFSTIITVVLAIAAIIFLATSIKVVQQSECIVVERLGRYSKTLTSGLNIIIPFLEQARSTWWVLGGGVMSVTRIDLRETVMDVDKQAVITRDNVSIDIDALLYIQVIDPVKAIYEISHLPEAVSQLAQTTLRNVIGEMDLDQTLVSRDIINSKLKHVLDEACDKWGTKVNRVEIKNITPPREIQVAMEKQMQAERERRAKVLEAEGDKQARIARSEGVRQEQINLAEGEKEAQVRRAEGEASAIRAVADAKKAAIEFISASLAGNTDLTAQYLIASQYIEEFGGFVQKAGDKVFVPYEASTALGALGSISEMLKDKGITSPSRIAPRGKRETTADV